MDHLTIINIRRDVFQKATEYFKDDSYRCFKVRDVSLGYQDRSFTNDPVLHVVTACRDKQGSNYSLVYSPGIPLPLPDQKGIHDLRGMAVELHWKIGESWFLAVITPKDSNPWYYRITIGDTVSELPNSLSFKIKCLEGVV